MKRESQAQQSGKLAGKTLKMVEEECSLLLQTDNLAFQAIFQSPILEVMNYLQQYEKYCYRAALSSLNLKIEEYDEYYSQLKGRIEDSYSTSAYRTMTMIQDLLVTLKLTKVITWKEQTAVANSLLLHSQDPYNFDSKQFVSDVNRVIKTLESPRSQLKDSITKIKECSENMKRVEEEKMDAMFGGRVSNPYVMTNKKGMQVNSSGLYASLLETVSIRMERNDESLIRRHSNIHQEIVRLGQSFCDHSIKQLRVANSAIKKYNQAGHQPYQLYSILQPPQLQGKKQFVNADQLCSGKQSQSDTKPALANRQLILRFSGADRVLDQETGREEVVEKVENEAGRKQWGQISMMGLVIKQSPFEVFAEKRRQNSLEFYQHRQFQKQVYREEQARDRSHFRENEKDNRVVYRKIYKWSTTPLPWGQLASFPSPIVRMYQLCSQKQQSIQDQVKKPQEEPPMIYSYRDALSQGREELLKKEEEEKREAEKTARQRQAFDFENRRQQQESTRLRQLKGQMQIRGYQKYMLMAKMQSKMGGEFIGVGGLRRYGINLQVQMENNSRQEADLFLFNYYRERYYREHSEVIENADNPIIFMDSTKINMQSSPKIVNSLIASITKRATSLNFFLVWSHDLICFRKTNSQQATIDVYPYYGSANAKKIVYELRRRLYIVLKQSIHEDYKVSKPGDEIYSKAEAAHRLIYDRHRHFPTLEQSVIKGRQIVAQIVQELRNREIPQ